MNDTVAAPRSSANFTLAILGGIIGSLLTVAALLFLTPAVLSGKIVRQGLLSDPRMLIDAQEALREAQFEPVLAANRAAIEKPFASSWKGAADPDVTLVEFFDYACPYCKASNPAIDRLVQEDKGLRVVYRELPILGPQSLTSARLSLAASQAGRFNQFHDALWAAGRPSPETNAAAARAAGISPEPTDDPAIKAEISRNYQLAGQLGATGTPLFIVGNRVLNGAVGYDTLKEAVEAARKKRG